jgi:hypothetical protein
LQRSLEKIPRARGENVSKMSAIRRAVFHPPLFYFILYLWRFFGSAEQALRMPSVLARRSAG